MTSLTEYLQTAVTELRERATELRTWPLDKWASETDALADHVQSMLAYHTEYAEDSDECFSCADQMPCPSLRSVATLVAAVTGNPVPA